jgi:hypothetical protein
MQSNEKGSEDSQISYRQQVIRALVQRYIESARREFEETKRKGTRGRCCPTLPRLTLINVLEERVDETDNLCHKSV